MEKFGVTTQEYFVVLDKTGAMVHKGPLTGAESAPARHRPGRLSTVDAPYALAVSAGILAAVNPCGFAMLPAYVSLLVTGQTAGRDSTVVARAAAAGPWR